MKSYRKSVSERLTGIVDWFIPADLKRSHDVVQSIRLFLFSHLFGPFLGNTISFAMLYLQGKADASWWIFFIAVTAFWLFPPALRLTGRYVPLALLSIQNLMFCVLWGCYQYGGMNSPIIPWLVTVPLLAFFYLPQHKTRIVIIVQIVLNLVAFFGVYAAFGFPSKVPLENLAILGIVSTFCASIYVSMMALYYANIASSQTELEQEIERHRVTETRLRDATFHIEQVMAAKSEFLAKMSHELRNPLNSIIGYAEIMLESARDPNNQKTKDLKSIRSAGKKLLELINDLLDLAKLEAGKMYLHVDQIDVRAFFNELVADWSQAFKEKGVEFSTEPPVSTQIRCDAAKIRRIVANLLSNAAKFTRQGRVTFSAAVRGNSIVFSVEDTGIGISADDLHGLFDTFSNTSDETASNYGNDVRLGLPLAYRYSQLLGGELSVLSELGVGSRFRLQLPVEIVDGQGGERESEIARGHSPLQGVAA
ncbi:MAG: HAMP domain-containing sensor histidine kinase [Bradyrhizobium sp.]